MLNPPDVRNSAPTSFCTSFRSTLFACLGEKLRNQETMGERTRHDKTTCRSLTSESQVSCNVIIQFENTWAMSKSLQTLGDWMIRRCTLTIGTLLVISVISHSYGKSMNITQFADDKDDDFHDLPFLKMVMFQFAALNNQRVYNPVDYPMCEEDSNSTNST